jgi:ribonuclease-3
LTAKSEPTELEKLLDHRFTRPALLTLALTHRSVSHERRTAAGKPVPAPAKAPPDKLSPDKPSPNKSARAKPAPDKPALDSVADKPVKDHPSSDNEQLEFLGDSVVGLLVAEDLCRRFPELQEGELTRLRAELVSRKRLAEVAARLDLGAHMVLGRGEERSGGRNKTALLANCMEAVIAALYLDGGMKTARAFVAREVIEPLAGWLRAELQSGSSIGDYKSGLQERAQARKLGQPEYVVKAESGPDHRKRFLVEVFLPTGEAPAKVLGRGVGGTKKKAEQEAARRALLRLKL